MYSKDLTAEGMRGGDQALRRADKTPEAIMDPSRKLRTDFEYDLEELPRGAQKAIVTELAKSDGLKGC